MSYEQDIIEGAAKAFFVPAWAVYQDEIGGENPGPGGNWMDIAPEPPKAAYDAARRFIHQVAAENGFVRGSDMLQSVAIQDGAVPDAEYAEELGYYLVMQSLGHGVSWADDHEDHGFRLPHVDAHVFGDGDDEIEISGLSSKLPGLRQNPILYGDYDREIYLTEEAEDRLRDLAARGPLKRKPIDKELSRKALIERYDESSVDISAIGGQYVSNPPPGWDKALTSKGRRNPEHQSRKHQRIASIAVAAYRDAGGMTGDWTFSVDEALEAAGFELVDPTDYGDPRNTLAAVIDNGNVLVVKLEPHWSEGVIEVHPVKNPPPGWDKVLTQKGQRMADDVESIAKKDRRYAGREGEVAYRTVLGRAKAGAKGLVHADWAREHGYPKPNPRDVYTRDEAHELLIDDGFKPVPGSSRFFNRRTGQTGRIVPAPGRGDTWYIEVEDDPSWPQTPSDGYER